MLEAMQLAKSQSDLTDYWPVGLYGDCNIGKVRHIKPAQLAFRCTINIMLLTYLQSSTGDVQTVRKTPFLVRLRYLSDPTD